MLGTLSKTDDGRHALRFERRLHHPPSKVWKALTDTGELRQWFVEILDYDRCRLNFSAGEPLSFAAKADLELPAGTGTVIRADAPALLEYTWDDETLRWELTPVEDGCLLVFTNFFPDRETAILTASGWHAGLDGLAALLDGRDPRAAVADGLDELYGRELG